jgi:hypothetical protein
MTINTRVTISYGIWYYRLSLEFLEIFNRYRDYYSDEVSSASKNLLTSAAGGAVVLIVTK